MIGSTDTASILMRQMAEQTEETILSQLKELLSRGLLVLERGPMKLTESRDGKISMSYSVQLKLSQQEYIEKLESENKELKYKLSSISHMFKDLVSDKDRSNK